MQQQNLSDFTEHKKEVLGKCPVCKTGNIIIHHGNFICTNHFVNADGHPRCSLSLPYDYRGGNITKEIVKELIEKGETKYIRMVSHKGSPYLSKLKVIPGSGIVTIYRKRYLGIKCPVCGGQVVSTNRSYCCENKLKKDSSCNFEVNHKLCNRIIRPEELADALNGGTKIIDGFYSKSGNFSGYLKMSEESRLLVTSRVGKCPSCGGDMLVGPSSFNCSNYRQGCTFKISREYDGHLLTAGEVRELLENGEVCVSGSDAFANIISCRLSIVKDGDHYSIKKDRFVSPEE